MLSLAPRAHPCSQPPTSAGHCCTVRVLLQNQCRKRQMISGVDMTSQIAGIPLCRSPLHTLMCSLERGVSRVYRSTISCASKLPYLDHRSFAAPPASRFCGVTPAEHSAILDLLDDPGRVPNDDAPALHILGHDAPRAHGDSIPNRHAGTDDDASADPAVVADRDGFGPLGTRRAVALFGGEGVAGRVELAVGAEHRAGADGNCDIRVNQRRRERDHLLGMTSAKWQLGPILTSSPSLTLNPCVIRSARPAAYDGDQARRYRCRRRD